MVVSTPPIADAGDMEPMEGLARQRLVHTSHERWNGHRRVVFTPLYFSGGRVWPPTAKARPPNCPRRRRPLLNTTTTTTPWQPPAVGVPAGVGDEHLHDGYRYNARRTVGEEEGEVEADYVWRADDPAPRRYAPPSSAIAGGVQRHQPTTPAAYSVQCELPTTPAGRRLRLIPSSVQCLQSSDDCAWEIFSDSGARGIVQGLSSTNLVGNNGVDATAAEAPFDAPQVPTPSELPIAHGGTRADQRRAQAASVFVAGSERARATCARKASNYRRRADLRTVDVSALLAKLAPELACMPFAHKSHRFLGGAGGALCLLLGRRCGRAGRDRIA